MLVTYYDPFTPASYRRPPHLKGTKMHRQADVLRAIADGHNEFEVDYDGHAIKIDGKTALFNLGIGKTVRFARQTVKIGTYDVPAPLTAPKDKVYRVHIHTSYESGMSAVTGLEHSTREAARLHAEALRSLTKPE